MRFEAMVDGELRPVTVFFGDQADVRAVSRWRVPKGAPVPVRDAVEFARLASKRWRHYLRSIPCAKTLDEFRVVSQNDSREEVSLILLAKAEWFSQSVPIGLAQCRKTYCNHLTLEFLSVHPRVVGGLKGAPKIRGIGSGLVFTLAALAAECGIQKIWDEATENSAPFYEKAFQLRDVKDLFIANPKQIAAALTGFREAAGNLR
jgi:hypothetical protein